MTTSTTANIVREIHEDWDLSEKYERLAGETLERVTRRIFTEIAGGRVKANDLVRKGRNNDTVGRYRLTGLVLELPGETDTPTGHISLAHYVRYLVNECANTDGIRLKGVKDALKETTDRDQAVKALRRLLNKGGKDKTDKDPMDTALGMLERAIPQVRAAMDKGEITPEQAARLIAAATDTMALAATVAAPAPVAV